MDGKEEEKQRKGLSISEVTEKAPQKYPKYQKGDQIVRLEPFARCLLPNYQGNRCDFCFTPNKFIFLAPCKGCHQKEYCSKECSRKDWAEGHRFECETNFFAKFKAVTTETELRFPKCQILLRMLIKLYADNWIDRRVDYPDGSSKSWREILQMDHLKRIKLEETRTETFTNFYKLITEIPKIRDALNVTLDQVMVLAKLIHWKFLILGNYFLEERYAECFYAELTGIDHCCVPSGGHLFKGSQLVIRSLEDNLAPDKVTIDYINGRQFIFPLNEFYLLLAGRYLYCECDICAACGMSLAFKNMCGTSGCNGMHSQHLIYDWEINYGVDWTMYAPFKREKLWLLHQIPLFVFDCKNRYKREDKDALKREDREHHPLITNALLRHLLLLVEFRKFERALEVVDQLALNLPVTHGKDDPFLAKLPELKLLLKDEEKREKEADAFLEKAFPDKSYFWYVEASRLQDITKIREEAENEVEDAVKEDIKGDIKG